MVIDDDGPRLAITVGGRNQHQLTEEASNRLNLNVFQFLVAKGGLKSSNFVWKNLLAARQGHLEDFVVNCLPAGERGIDFVNR